MKKFIVIEGGEGSGKSTLIAALKEKICDKAIFAREPGGSPYAETIRNIALKNPLAKDAPIETTLCLMFAARFDNIKNLISPALQSNKPVIVDRFDASSFAYNIYPGSNKKLDSLFWEMRSCLPVLPDLYVFLDIDPLIGLKRVANRRLQSNEIGQYDHFDDREIEFHSKVREGYLKFFASKNIKHIVIDASRPLNEVKKDFFDMIDKNLM